ncbi:prepilin peptidase [Cohnella pontilimi]|uniref:Prepilin peptidase n=1 Tax=Cohnella pontilimi TaxID=2564100 RepID=A0A4U0F9G4_9BACL|nr:A24 family peptidase [Cohnella pontilimi]TJY40724.1 prepilin peptidase [Cohnella pontilimi]
MWADILLLFVLAVCVVTDLRSRKIYNLVIFPSLIFAIGVHALTEGWTGLGQALLGFAAGLGILLLPYLLGGMGAGDVKLLALVGALKGVGFVFATSIYMALLGAIMAVFVVLFKNGIRERLRYIGFVLLCLRVGVKPSLRGHWTSGAYPYGVAIAGGSVACLVLKGWGAG